jgi:hypothetical protein
MRYEEKEVKEVVEQIDKHIKALEEKLQKTMDYLNGIIGGMEKMANDKIQALSEGNYLKGSIAAYNNISSEMKKMLGINEEAFKSVDENLPVEDVAVSQEPLKVVETEEVK